MRILGGMEKGKSVVVVLYERVAGQFSIEILCVCVAAY